MRIVLLLISILPLLFGANASGLCVTANVANLREKPTSKAKLTLVVGKYTPLQELGRQGPWYQVKDLDGRKHWIFKSLVSSQVQCLIVKSKVANIRTGPGSNFALADYPTANRYFVFKKLDSEDEWLQIQSPSGRGPFWIHENLVWRAFKVHSISF